MNIFQYTQLTTGQKQDVLEKAGVLLAERERSFYQIKLYQVEEFYVEVYLHSHFNVVVNINAFTNVDCLDPYLQSINIDELTCV
ncbi:MAG TPA: hypothetical protein VEZ55_11710 [Chitinophagaceae bacterium]|jgi:hypothetical protein|nr:hypothetical protein [Chitinophagaceae bacterium]